MVEILNKILLVYQVVASPERLQLLYDTPNPGEQGQSGSASQGQSDASGQEGSTFSQSEFTSARSSAAGQDRITGGAGSAAGQDRITGGAGSAAGQDRITGGAGSSNQINDGSDSNSASTVDLSPSTDQGVFLGDSRAAINVLNPDGLEAANVGAPLVATVTLTEESTIDFFTTLVNVFYNTVPVTLTEFVKSTATVPTFLVSEFKIFQTFAL